MKNHFESSLLAGKRRFGKWIGLCAILALAFGGPRSALGTGYEQATGSNQWGLDHTFDYVEIGSGGTAIVTSTMNNITVTVSGTTTLCYGANGTGYFYMNIGKYTTSYLVLGSVLSSTGGLTIAGGTYTTTNTSLVGAVGSGSVTVSKGVWNGGSISIGDSSTGNGTVTVTGGTAAYNSISVGTSGTGTLNLSGSGVVSVASGTGTLVVASGTGTGTLNLGDGSSSVGTLNVSTVTGGSGNATVNFNASGVHSYNQSFTGSLKVNQIGSGTTTLTGTSTYTGLTTVSAGELKVNGSLATTGTVKVTSGGRLSGSGTVGNVNVTGGTVAPGNSPGTLSVTSLTLDSTSTLEMQITGTTAGTFDQVQVSDYVSLSGTLALTGLDALTELGATITLISIDGTAVAKVLGQFTSVTVSGTSVAVTNSTTTSTFTYNDVEYEVDYNGGDGNDVTITVVPEPSSWALLIGGVGFLAWRKRRRGSW